MNLFTFFEANRELIIFVLTALTITLIIIVLSKLLTRKRVSYSPKEQYVTETEQAYYYILLEIAGNNYYVFPQVNLASVISKDTPGYRTELFRNVDFGFFDASFRPVLLIEINDGSHLRNDRKERDKSVNKICKMAKIPLLTFWTKDGINAERIKKAVNKYINN